MRSCPFCANKWIMALGVAVLLAVGALGASYGLGLWPFQGSEPETPPVSRDEGDKPVPLEAKGPKHQDPQVVLARTLERLHHESLAHFHADPSNGMRRMPVIHEKVVKEWKMPHFSPGELDDSKPIPFRKDMEMIHAGSMKDFLTVGPLTSKDKEVPTRRVFPRMDFEKWAALNKDKKHWEAKSIDLIGLVKYDKPVVYSSEKAAETKEVVKRELDDFEMVALNTLHKGEDLAAHSRDGHIRMLGAVRANASCIKCHDGAKEGDLLGAFSYTLREAEYKSGIGRFGGAPKAAPK